MVGEVVDMKEFTKELKEECEDLYLFFIEEKGMTEGEALSATADQRKAIKEYNSMYDGCGMYNSQVQKSLPLETLRENTNWSVMKEWEKDKLLWDLGVNTKCFKYQQSYRRTIKPDNKTDIVEMVYGFERLDKTWINSGYCSNEAIGLASGGKYKI